jgi:ATP-dependent DNA helicase RecQ
MHQISIAKRVRTPTGVNLYKKIYEKTDDKLKEFIKQTSMDTYQQEAKPLQVDTVFNLARGRNTFLLAGTGFGKSRISEMYFKMIPKMKRAVVLVLNPLDALGDNQVLEKEKAGFTAINLTQMNFNKQTAEAIMNGDYNFIYLSPEIFLNSKAFDKVYFSTTFQNRLALIVIDEAHMVYIWGLVESSTSKTITSVHLRIEDYALFRPCYGKLGPHLLFRNDKPILLLSATCRPVAVEGIMKSLKLNDDNLDILRGELTRPEIRIIRVTMDYSLASTLDLVKLFPSSKDVLDDDLVPSLIYSSSRNRTLTAMAVIDMARETPGAAFMPPSTCIRRFHSCTGDQDKVDCIDDFASGRFPLISCTMALGLGQNWKRVRLVVHIGRGDPASVCQMIGRCGRDGRPGLAIMLVEKNLRNGKNSVDQFAPGALQTDPDRMDALAITPVCLRIAFSLDNLYVFVPYAMRSSN